MEKIVDSVRSRAPIPLRTIPIDVDPERINEFARTLSGGGNEALRNLGVTEVSAVTIDNRTFEITVQTPNENVPAATTISGFSIAFEGSTVTKLDSRDWDGPPWSGGAQLRNTSTLGSPACTAGFNWVRSDTGERMGSTAEHCYSPSGQSWWYNHGYPVGQRWYYSTVKDTQLLRSYLSVSQFNPNVFVGGAATGTIRTVIGAMASDPVNGAVALSGGVSGLNVGKITGTTAYIGGAGPMRYVINNPHCKGGDSGGPWLATNAAGNVIAYGQHVAHSENASGATVGCWYSPVTPISAAIGAYILTG